MDSARRQTRVFYSDAYVSSAHGFDTTRKSRWIAESLSREPIDGVSLVEPAPTTEHALAQVHDPAYVRAVQSGEPRALAESQGFRWDPGLWRMVCASNGGVLAAVDAALSDGVSGSLSSGLHHARRDRGAGYCTFNGLALAARAARARGLGAILIVDLDAHCGGGTHSLLRDDTGVWQLDVSVCDYDDYATNARTTLDVVSNAGDYLPAVASRLEALARDAPRFELCLYNAGMDPFERCGVDGLHGISHDVLRERERLVFAWCAARGLPVAYVMAGGYTGDQLAQDELVALHRYTLAEAGVARRAV